MLNRKTAENTTSANAPTNSHDHERFIGVLRYRGLENEAVMAARLVKVESLKATLQSVLSDLDASIEAWVTPGVSVEQEVKNGENDNFRYDLQRIARKNTQFVEEMLETALSKIRTSARSVNERPVWESEQGFGAHATEPKRDMNYNTMAREARQA